MKKLDQILHYFKKINEIPRSSKHEDQVAKYLLDFAKSHNLEAKQDEIGNVVIRKKASTGYEEVPMVTIQGHLDMVAEKVNGSTHDFLRDPIVMKQEGDLLRAEGTTLGADNGIALAMALVILEDDTLTHPALELLATVDEETEMTGALNLKPDFLQGHYLLNLDSEEEGDLTVGSAGGELLTLSLKKDLEVPSSKDGYEVSFSGFLGGHSGMMIQENKGNMIKVMGRFLELLTEKQDLQIASLSSGTKDNSIPREGTLSFTLGGTVDFDQIITQVKDENKEVEGDLSIQVAPITLEKVYSKEQSKALIGLMKELPTGVNAFEKADASLVETSSNLAVLKESEDTIELQVSTRSSIHDKILELREKIQKIGEKHGADVQDSGYYPGWQYREDSKLRETALKTYRELFGKEMNTIIIHAGLECGAILEVYPAMDAISIGPDIKDAHTPDENLSLSSTERVYEHVLAILKNLK